MARMTRYRCPKCGMVLHRNPSEKRKWIKGICGKMGTYVRIQRIQQSKRKGG